MRHGRRYIRSERRKLNIIKVIIALLIIIITICIIYRSVQKKNIKKEILDQEEISSNNDNSKNDKDDKSIEDYMKEYDAELIQKVTDDMYYVSMRGKECTLYSDGTVIEEKVILWSGGIKQVEIDNKSNSITIDSAEELKWIIDQIISGERNFNGITILLNNNIDLGGRINSNSELSGNKWSSGISFLNKTETEEVEKENKEEKAEESTVEEIENNNNNIEKLKGFAGIFNGNDHWIKGMIIESNDKYQGLFGYLSGTIRNLTIKDSYISGTEGVGAFAGLNNGKIENCKLENSIVKGNSKVGGFVGISMTDSKVRKCTNDYSKNTILGDEYVGGIVGYLNNNSTVTNCDNKSKVEGKKYVGGIAGISFFGASINTCSNEIGEITGEDYVGGISGYSQSQIEKCYNKSTISGNSFVGGIAGLNYTMGNVTISYNIGDVNGSKDFVGGIAGVNNANIESTYNCGRLSLNSSIKETNVGGIAGQNISESAIKNSYNIGKIFGNGYTGGIAGNNYGVISNCYYLESVVKEKNKNAVKESELKNIDIGNNFKADIENINGGYPILSWQ